MPLLKAYNQISFDLLENKIIKTQRYKLAFYPIFLYAENFHIANKTDLKLGYFN